MSFEWPEFGERVLIDENRSWTAAFDSYRQYTEDCYYLVTLYEGDGVKARFIVEVALWWDVGGSTGPDFADRLRQEIGRAAEAGETNCEYGRMKERWAAEANKTSAARHSKG